MEVISNNNNNNDNNDNNNQTTTQETKLTSTTAPGQTFPNRTELAKHYKSDYHRYNLKRREAGLNMIRLEDYKARLEAALALRKEREERDARDGEGHLKKDKKKKKSKKKKKGDDDDGRKLVEKEEVVEKKKKEGSDDVVVEEEKDDLPEKEEEEEKAEIIINPKQSLFDNHTSPTITSNVRRMQRKFDFFIPDAEYLVDLEGLIGYCSEKIILGKMCLYCQKGFGTGEACKRHMISKAHTKILYERGVDQEEFDVFYDFGEADRDFLGHHDDDDGGDKKDGEFVVDHDHDEEDDDDESGEWEDISDDEQEEEQDQQETQEQQEEEDEHSDSENDDIYAEYQEEIAQHGFDITPLGELVFPDGRIVGHRGLSRYYKQRIRPEKEHRTDGIGQAFAAARIASNERLVGGRVYSMGATTTTRSRSSLVLMTNHSLLHHQDCGGKGILVSAAAGGGGGFTSISLYRYRAAVKKARRGDDKGRRLHHRTQLNMNRMDKKGNRLMNNVSVAHAPR